MVAWSAKEIEDQMLKGDALVGLWGNEVFAYIGLISWPMYVEISTLIVSPEYRQKYIGMLMVSMAVFLAKNNYPAKQIIVLPNQVSQKICQKVGFIPKPKNHFDKVIWDLCDTCLAKDVFPDCHCQPMILE